LKNKENQNEIQMKCSQLQMENDLVKKELQNEK
jgi:hypothetical protein